MKKIVVKDTDKIKALDILKRVIQQAGGDRGQINVSEIRKRIRIEDVIEAAKSDKLGGHILTFEDADWSHLKTLYENFAFMVYDKELLTIWEALDSPLEDEEKEVVANGKDKGKQPNLSR